MFEGSEGHSWAAFLGVLGDGEARLVRPLGRGVGDWGLRGEASTCLSRLRKKPPGGALGGPVAPCPSRALVLVTRAADSALATCRPVGATVAGCGRSRPGGRPPAVPSVLPPAPPPRGERMLTVCSGLPFPHPRTRGGRRPRERARKLCEPAGSPTWQAWGRPGPALRLRSDGWRLSASGGQCVCVDAASLCWECWTLRAHVWPRISEEALAFSPAAPLGWSQDAGSRASRGPSLSSGCWGLPWVPGPASGSWVVGVSGSGLP